VEFSWANPTALFVAAIISMVIAGAWFAHFASYRWIKERALEERRWDYNICCGTTDGGGINADIVRHGDVPRFELVRDVTRLPHPDMAFEHVLCSHTIEHVPDPQAMFHELCRVGRNVTILVPPLWDFTAAFNPFEHQVIFLSLRSRHQNELPRYVRFAPARWLQARMGQKVNADALAGDSGRRLARMLDYAVPVSFLAAGWLGFSGSPRAWWVFAPGWALFYASKKLPSLKTGIGPRSL